MSKLINVYKNFNKGFNDTTAEDTLLEQELALAENITLSSRGGYSKRTGSMLISSLTSEAPITKMFRFSSGGVSFRCDVCNNQLFFVTADGVSTLAASLYSGGKVDFEYFNNGNIYFVDGQDYRSFGSSKVVSSVVPAAGTNLDHIKRCTIIAQRGQRLFASGDPQNPNLIYFCEIGEPNNFPSANAINAVSDDGDSITALVELGDKLIAFKDSNIYVWSGWDPTSDVTFDRLPIHGGTKSPESVVRVDNMIIFLAHDSIVGLSIADNGYISVSDLSTNLKNTIKSLVNKDKIVASYYDGSYLMACCDDESVDHNNLVLRGYVSFAYSTTSDRSGQTKTVPWTTIRGWSVSSWFNGGDEKLYFGDHLGNAYQAFINKDDNGQPIEVDVIHRLNLADSFKIKKIKSLLILVSQETHLLSNARVELNYGFKTDMYDLDLNEAMVWGVTPWGYSWGYTDIVKKEIRTNEKANRLQLRITQNKVNQSLNNDLLIYGIGVVFRTKRPKGDRKGIEYVTNQ